MMLVNVLMHLRILVLGIAYKRDVADLRESPAIEIIDLLREHKAEVDYVDPYIPVITLKKEDVDCCAAR